MSGYLDRVSSHALSGGNNQRKSLATASNGRKDCPSSDLLLIVSQFQAVNVQQCHQEGGH